MEQQQQVSVAQLLRLAVEMYRLTEASSETSNESNDSLHPSLSSFIKKVATSTTKTVTVSSKQTKSKNTSKPAKKRTWKKPSDKPKRPLSAYNLFFQSERENIIGSEAAAASSSATPRRQRQKHGKIGFADLARQISARWKTLDESEKAIFKARAAVEKKKYELALEEWKRENEAKKKLEGSPPEAVIQITTDDDDVSSLSSSEASTEASENASPSSLTPSTIRREAEAVTPDPEELPEEPTGEASTQDPTTDSHSSESSVTAPIMPLELDSAQELDGLDCFDCLDFGVDNPETMDNYFASDLEASDDGVLNALSDCIGDFNTDPLNASASDPTQEAGEKMDDSFSSE